jgi:glycine cleavage system H protein
MLMSIQHVWVDEIESSRARIGLTAFAQAEFGEIVFAELPGLGFMLRIGEPFANIESVKTVTELPSPVWGRVVEVNERVLANPSLINEAAEGAGWLVEVELDELAEGLLTPAQYGEMYQAG